MKRRAPQSPASNPVAAAVGPDETLAALARTLDFAEPGRFVLAFAKCNLPVQRRALVERLKVMLDPLGVTLIEVDLAEPIDRLLPILRDHLNRPYLVPAASLDSAPEVEGALAVRESRGKTALFVYSLEHSLPSSQSNSPILMHLNLSRELFRRDVPCPLVIWLPDYALTMLARGAPDFWAWRSGVYEFPPEVETVRRVTGEAVYEADLITSSLSAEAKRERLHLLARLLDDYRELGDGPRERSTQADILLEMGNVYYDLGEWAEARRLYDQSLQLARELGNKQGIASTLHQLAMLAQDTGDLVEARRLYN